MYNVTLWQCYALFVAAWLARRHDAIAVEQIAFVAISIPLQQ
jgi:hypothetical protein